MTFGLYLFFFNFRGKLVKGAWFRVWSRPPLAPQPEATLRCLNTVIASGPARSTDCTTGNSSFDCPWQRKIQTTLNQNIFRGINMMWTRGFQRRAPLSERVSLTDRSAWLVSHIDTDQLDVTRARHHARAHTDTLKASVTNNNHRSLRPAIVHFWQADWYPGPLQPGTKRCPLEYNLLLLLHHYDVTAVLWARTAVQVLQWRVKDAVRGAEGEWYAFEAAGLNALPRTGTWPRTRNFCCCCCE